MPICVLVRVYWLERALVCVTKRARIRSRGTSDSDH